MKTRRVAISGLGIVSSLGVGRQAFWEALLAGRSGFSPVSSFDAAGYRTKIGGEVRAEITRDAAVYAETAAKEALEDAGVDLRRLTMERAGVALGTTSGELVKLASVMDKRVAGGSRSDMLSDALPHFPAGITAGLAKRLGFAGANVMLTTACGAGNAALAYAFEKIRSGEAELMLAGGVDVFTRLHFAGFNRLLAVAPEVCAPFSKDRMGLIPSEGCAVLVLEDLESALAAGREVYAEMLGYGLSSDASHVTLPAVGGVSRALVECLKTSGLKPGDVDYISAHGTGTPANDRTETAAIKKVFGVKAKNVPVSSIKSMLGHAMGAASALEAAASCLSLKTGFLPPTIHFTGGDPECDLDYVPDKARKTDPRVILSNGFAFGGQNAVIALARPGRRRALAPNSTVRAVITGIAVVEDRNPLALAEKLLPDHDLGFLDVPMAFALCGAQMALADAGLDSKRLGGRAGIILESSGELESLYRYYSDLAKDGPNAVEPRLFPNTLANAAASRVAIHFGLMAMNVSLAGSYPGGEAALALALTELKRDPSRIILAGGVDQGALMLVVESLAAARRRGAKIYAEVLSSREGYDSGKQGRSTDCFCLAQALRRIGHGSVEKLTYRARGVWGNWIVLELGAVRKKDAMMNPRKSKGD